MGKSSQTTMVHCLDWFKRFCRIRAFWCLLLGYVLFTFFGGLVFMAIEMPEEKSLRAEVQKLRERFLQDHHCMQESKLNDLLRKVLSTDRRGVSVLDVNSEEYHYDFTSSLFFVIVTLSTTGYDFFTPISEAAKLFCIFYCIVGIPLTLFILSCLSDFLQPIVTHAPVRHIQTHWAMPYSRAALVHASLLCLVIVTLLFLLPALSFCFLEPEWSFLDALFFCYITLSTIGQGGYMLGRSMDRTARDALKVFTTCYLMAGLVVILTFRETALDVPLVQAVIRLFSGPREGELKGIDLGEFVLSGDSPLYPDEEPQYALPISTISPCPLDPALPSSDQTPPPSFPQTSQPLPPPNPPLPPS